MILERFAIAYLGNRRSRRYGAWSGSDRALSKEPFPQEPDRYRSRYRTTCRSVHTFESR
jgi:hypothetical protein